MASNTPSCRVLTISSSIAQARRVAERIITLSNSAQRQVTTPTAEEDKLDWTISNKYYTAPVHFSLAQTTKVVGGDAAEVPACIFVFAVTETFKEDFKSLTDRLEGADFEVSIAVSVPPADGAKSPTTDEHDALEEFFGDHSFEYVNGSLDQDLTQEHDIDDMEGIPGIGRIIDALSTILWPSMIQNSGSRRAKARSVVSVPGPPGEEEGLRSLLNADRDKETVDTPHVQRREVDALEKWLEEGADDDKDPWAGVTHPQVDTYPSSIVQATPATGLWSGFDDNFSDFVSAPSAEINLPSHEEIESMSQRILTMGISEDADTDEDGSQTPFDLSRVLAGLEAMKEEIAGIADEDERRKAAAKVALGLVYGLSE